MTISDSPRTDALRAKWSAQEGARNSVCSPEAHGLYDHADALERELSAALADVERIKKENDTLRGLLGNSAKPCPYCGLAAEDQAKCPRGFPGCSRADDQMLSKHFADTYVAEQAEKDVVKLTKERDAQKSSSEALAIRLLGQERYDNSPCQAHPLELVEEAYKEQAAQLAQAEAEVAGANALGMIRIKELEAEVAKLKGFTCENEGCPHYGTPPRPPKEGGNMSASDTPRTNAVVRSASLAWANTDPLVALARTLERELAAALAENAKLTKEREGLIHLCCGEFEQCEKLCIPRADHFKMERDALKLDAERLDALVNLQLFSIWTDYFPTARAAIDALRKLGKGEAP